MSTKRQRNKKNFTRRKAGEIGFVSSTQKRNYGRKNDIISPNQATNMNEKTYEKVPSFNPHSNCQGHGIYVLDCEYTDKEDRDLLVKCLDNYITNEAN